MVLRQALLLLQQGEFEPAASVSRDLLRLQPGHVGAKTVLGLALGALEQPREAARLLDEVARAQPSSPHPSHALTGLLETWDRQAAIVPQYEACLELAQHDASIRLALAEHLRPLRQTARIRDLLAPVLDAEPAHLPALVMLGNALVENGEYEPAEALFRRATRVAPDEAIAWTNLGMVLKVLGRFPEALEAADCAVALRPQDAQIRLNRGILKLRAGLLTEAWDDYDGRLGLPGRGPLPPERLLRDVEQIPAAPGTRLLVVHEDGFGDTVMYIRYASLLAARGVQVLAAVPAPLVPLLARMPGIARVLGPGAPVPEYDLHCHVCDLARVFRSTIDSIPNAVPYLVPDPDLVAAWAQRLPPAEGRLRVGLVWAGEPRASLPGMALMDAFRSTTLATLAPLASVPGLQFISLQKGAAAAQAAKPPPGMALHDPMAQASDFHQTAAIVANLDLVVSVDTAMAHVSGALGCRVLLLDRFDSCWRWFHGREDSPWYPTLRILRQTRLGDWAPVAARAAAILAELAATHATAGARTDPA